MFLSVSFTFQSRKYRQQHRVHSLGSFCQQNQSKLVLKQLPLSEAQALKLLLIKKQERMRHSQLPVNVFLSTTCLISLQTNCTSAINHASHNLCCCNSITEHSHGCRFYFEKNSLELTLSFQKFSEKFKDTFLLDHLTSKKMAQNMFSRLKSRTSKYTKY